MPSMLDYPPPPPHLPRPACEDAKGFKGDYLGCFSCPFCAKAMGPACQCRRRCSGPLPSNCSLQASVKLIQCVFDSHILFPKKGLAIALGWCGQRAGVTAKRTALTQAGEHRRRHCVLSRYVPSNWQGSVGNLQGQLQSTQCYEYGLLRRRSIDPSAMAVVPQLCSSIYIGIHPCILGDC